MSNTSIKAGQTGLEDINGAAITIPLRQLVLACALATNRKGRDHKSRGPTACI